MRTETKVYIFLLGLVLHLPSVAHGKSPTLIEGAGSYFCSELTLLASDRPEDAEYKFVEWVRGFFTGLNTVLVGSTGYMNDLEGAQIEDRVYPSILELCLQDPESRVYFKALDVWDKLEPVKYEAPKS